MEKVCIFETDRKNVRESTAHYRDPKLEPKTILELLTTPPRTQKKKEYCTEKYSKDTFRLICAGDVTDPFFKREIVWEA